MFWVIKATRYGEVLLTEKGNNVVLERGWLFKERKWGWGRGWGIRMQKEKKNVVEGLCKRNL